MLGNEKIQHPMITSGGVPPSSKHDDEFEERPTKWGDESEKTFNPPSFPGIARGIPLEDLEYLMRLYRLDELTKKKNLGQYEIPDREIRSESPEPIFDKDGKRINTVEQRAKEEMNRELQSLIEECMAMNPKFIPPVEWRNLKKSRKIFIPESQDGKNNYAGIILGPGGTTQKRLETKSKCKISIRGRQSYMVTLINNQFRNEGMIMTQMRRLIYSYKPRQMRRFLGELRWLKGFLEVSLKISMMMRRQRALLILQSDLLLIVYVLIA